MRQRPKIAVFVLLFGLLWLPILQEKSGYFNETPLKGAFVVPAKPEFSMDSLIELKFQKQFEDLINFDFGFRAFLVKLRNSANYVLFRELSNKDFICGKDNFIFDGNHIKYTLGMLYNGKEKNDQTVSKIKFLSDGLEKRGIKFLCLMVPSKEQMLNEYLPSYFRDISKRPTNFSDYKSGFENNKIPYLDLGKYLASKMGPDAYPFYTKTGSHWSMYGASFAEDTLVEYLQNVLEKKLPQYKRTGDEISDTARGDDKDFEGALNLLFSLKQDRYLYPKLEIVESTKKNFRPKVIIIGDSFVWQLKYQGMFKYLFSDDSKFWYYFNNISAPMGDQPMGSLKDLNIMKELESADVVILEGSPGTSDWYPFGLADYYYDNIAPAEIIECVKRNVAGNGPWIQNLRSQRPPDMNDEEMILAEVKRVCRDKEVISIKAANGKFICAGATEQKELLANRDAASDWETYNMLKLGNGMVAIYSYKNTFLSAELGQKNEITSTRNNIGDWEMFRVEGKGDGFVAFKASNGKYLSLDGKSLQIVASANSVGVNEKFKLIVTR
ncbi:MAG: alginate O-acetyltransferase AlgX-related protein [Bacteroidia bacterium]